MTVTTATTVTGRINGRELTLQVDNATLLLDLLRDMGLTGAKPSCEMEVCGACTMLVDAPCPHRVSARAQWRPSSGSTRTATCMRSNRPSWTTRRCSAASALLGW